jgi:hypothetical protein
MPSLINFVVMRERFEEKKKSCLVTKVPSFSGSQAASELS